MWNFHAVSLWRPNGSLGERLNLWQSLCHCSSDSSTLQGQSTVSGSQTSKQTSPIEASTSAAKGSSEIIVKGTVDA